MTTTETIAWHQPEQAMPEADATVLLAVQDLVDGDPRVVMGWWDGTHWRDTSHGGPIGTDVLHWATVMGPAT